MPVSGLPRSGLVHPDSRCAGGGHLNGPALYNYCVLYTFSEQLLVNELEKNNNDINIISFFTERLGIAPEGRQKEVLDCGSKRVIVNCSRQWGKSLMAAGKALHTASTRAGSLVLVASPTERQSAEFVRKVKTLALSAGERVKGDGDNRVSLRLANGSRIVGLPGTEATVRGFSNVSLLIIDEASRVEDDLYHALRPVLAASDGDLWMMSTPMGKRGFFYEAWEYEERWAKFKSPVTECPRVKAEFIEEEREVQGDMWFRQEYLCEFLDNGTEVFGRELVESALVDGECWPLGEKPAGGWVTPLAHGKVTIGVDLGKRQDYSAIAVLEQRPGGREAVVRYLERMPLGTGYVRVVERVRELATDGRLGARKHVVVDATGLGGPVVDMRGWGAG